MPNNLCLCHSANARGAHENLQTGMKREDCATGILYGVFSAGHVGVRGKQYFPCSVHRNDPMNDGCCRSR